MSVLLNLYFTRFFNIVGCQHSLTLFIIAENHQSEFPFIIHLSLFTNDLSTYVHTISNQKCIKIIM